MSLIDTLFKRFQTQVKSVPTGFFGFFAPTSPPKMKESEYANAYAGWVYACVNAIAERVADIDLLLEQKKGDQWQKIESHPSLDLLNNPNDFMSFYDFVFSYEAFQQINGNTFIYVVPNGNKVPVEMWILDPKRVSIIKDKQEYISGYYYQPEGGDKILLKPEEVLYFKRFTPNDQWRGVGTVQAAALPIDIDTYSAEWQRNFFANAAMPSGLLSTEGKLTQDQYDRIKTNWDAKFKGVPNAHKMALLEGGLKWQDISPTSREMQFTESRKNIRDEILAYFGVPKPMLGILEDVNLASADAADLLFSKMKIRPRMKSFVVGLNKFYLPMFKLDPKVFRFNFTDPVPENIEQKLSIIANGRTNHWMTANEAREMFSYDGREDGNNLDLSTMEAPIEGSDQPDDPAHEAEDEQEEEDETDDTKGVKKNVKSKPVERTQESKKKEQDYKQQQIAALHKTYLGLNNDLEKELLSRLKQYKSAATHTKEPETLLKRLLRASGKASVGEANDLVKFLFSNYEDWIGLVYNATKDGLTRIFEQSGKDTFSDLDLEGSFDLQNPRALDWLSEHAMEDSTSYTDTMKEDIAVRVQEGVEQGLSNDKIADSLSEFFDGQSDYRAMRIARTETINAYGAGNLEGFKQSDVISGKFWIPDAEACDICLGNADDGVIALDDDFSSGDDAPTAHPNAVLEGTTFLPYGELKEMVSADYEGPAVVISTSNDRDITIGPNHPMLTQRGLIKASELSESDYLIYDTRIDDNSSFAANSDFKKIPLVEDAFDSLISTGAKSLVSTPRHDLHGDRAFCKGEVNVIKPADCLLPIFNSGKIEEFRQSGFMGTDMKTILLSGDSTSSFGFDGINLPTSGDMSSGLSGYKFVHIRSIHYVEIKCKAYDASTESGLYNSNGFVVSNCECSLGGQTDEDA